ncbi:MAG: hypothetical protein QW534_03130 [Candidatus Methanomethylicia archaeon]
MIILKEQRGLLGKDCMYKVSFLKGNVLNVNVMKKALEDVNVVVHTAT